MKLVFRKRRTLTVFLCLLALGIFLTSVIHYKLICHTSSLKGLSDFNSLEVDFHAVAAAQGKVFMPILMPVCGRKKFLETVLRSLDKVSNINETVLIISDDCKKPEVVKLLNEAKLSLPVIRLYHTRPYFSIPTLLYGNNEYATAHNVYFLMKFAFDYLKAPSAIILESDLEPGKDMYNYFQWTFKAFLDPKTEIETPWKGKTLCVNGYGDQSFPARSDMDPYKFYPYIFVVWGWMTSRDRWIRNFRDHWTPMRGWDHWIQNEVRVKQGLYCMSPHLSRIKNIGYQGENYKMSLDEYEKSDLGKIRIDRETERDFKGKTPIVSDKIFHI